MKRMRKTVAFLLATALTASMAPSQMLIPHAVEQNATDSNAKNDSKSSSTTIKVHKAWGMTGNQATVVLSMENNPGIVGLTLQIAYNESEMTLVSSENGTAVSGSNITFTPPASGKNFVWHGTSVKPDEVSDGTLLTLVFDVKESAKLGEYPIVVSCTDALDNNLQKVPVTIDSGSIAVIDYVPGDTSGDGKIAMTDLVLLTRYIADGGYNENGYAAKVNTSACDVNSDGSISVLDAVVLARYIADGCKTNPNGYNVTLLPAPFQCSHSSLKHIEAVEAVSCKEDGNTEYWYCENCDKYFSDELCEHEIPKDETVVKGEHTIVIDPAVAPTSEKTGLTEGSHCSVCGEVVKKQETVPVLKEKGDYSITYNIAGNDTYLASLNLQNPEENKTSYSSGDEFYLSPIEVPGYNFLGWYDGQGENANEIKLISPNDHRNLKLYAHWNKAEYYIDFETDKTVNNPDKKQDNLVLPSLSYTVDRGTTLPNLSLNGYYFMGWVDENNNLIESIPQGTVGNIKLYPVWTSQRNSTHPNDYASEGAVAITDWNDENGNTNISFVYNLGTIENVPLYQVDEWMNGSGVEQAIEKTISKSVSKECSKNFVNAISKATTNSLTWTLSSDWNETIEEDTEILKTISREQIEAAQTYYENTGSWSIGASLGGNKTTSNSEGKSSKTTTGDKESAGAEVGTGDAAPVHAKIKADAEVSHGKEEGETQENITTNSGYWNLEGGFSGSSMAGGSNSFSQAITDSLSKSDKYGRIVSEGGSVGKESASEQYQSSTNSYSNTFVYSTDEIESTTVKYTLPVEAYGYYRRVLVGTAYVFAVVNYNIATQQYYVNTYSVIDEKSYNSYWDYSASTTAFNDHQKGVLPFAVPIEANEYIGSLTTRTEGLTVNKETGIINGYTGSDTGVIIPQYISYDNMDGTFKSVKITGIASDTFAGNKDIVAIYLPDSVTEIPAGAFKGCTSLKKVVGKNIKSIGTKAFQNCTSLESFTVGSSVTKIGDNAFENAGCITVNATNSAVAAAACGCGANSVILNLKECSEPLENMTMKIPNTTKSFKLEGAGKTLTNVQIVSDAESTELQNVNMNNTTGRPLVTSSNSLTIGSTKINAPSLAVVLLADDTAITAYGQSSIVTKGDYAILSHNESYSGAAGNDIAKVNVTGNIAVCGKIESDQLINFNSGKIITIDEDQFNNLLNNAFSVTFDANGGTVEQSSIQASAGTALGTLPVPSMEDRIFAGWFTKDGTQVTEKTVFKEANDITVYAKWISITLNKSVLMLNTDGASKTYQLSTSYANPDDVVWASSDPSIATVSAKGLVTALADGTAKITATASGASVSCDVTVKTAYDESWSDWSEWTTNKIEASETVDVKTDERKSQVLVSYNMDSYCTVANNPWRRQYRNFSVNGNYGDWGLSSTYGEYHNTWTYTVGEVEAAAVIHPGEQQGGGQTGTNMADVNGYSMLFGSDYYIFFITSENYDTITTTVYSSRNLIKTPVEYKN